MTTHYMPMARCPETGQTVKSNDLGKRFGMDRRRDAELQAESLAKSMKYKTGKEWQGFVQLYTIDDLGRTFS